MGEVARVAVHLHSELEVVAPGRPNNVAIVAIVATAARLAAAAKCDDAPQLLKTPGAHPRVAQALTRIAGAKAELLLDSLDRRPVYRKGVHVPVLCSATNVSDARTDYDSARNARCSAENELMAAIRSGDPRRIKAAQAKLTAAKEIEAIALANYNRVVAETAVETKRVQKDGEERIARARQGRAAAERRVADLQAHEMRQDGVPSEVHADGTELDSTGSAKHHLNNADSEVSLASFQLTSDIRDIG